MVSRLQSSSASILPESCQVEEIAATQVYQRHSNSNWQTANHIWPRVEKRSIIGLVVSLEVSLRTRSRVHYFKEPAVVRKAGAEERGSERKIIELDVTFERRGSGWVKGQTCVLDGVMCFGKEPILKDGSDSFRLNSFQSFPLAFVIRLVRRGCFSDGLQAFVLDGTLFMLPPTDTLFHEKGSRECVAWGCDIAAPPSTYHE